MKRYSALAWRELLAQRVTSVLILLAIVLSTMMTAAIGQSAGILSMREQQAIAIGGDRHAGLVQMDREQLAALQSDPRLSFAGSYVVLGSMRLDNTLLLGLSEFQEDVSAIYPSISAIKEGRLPRPPWKLPCPRMCWNTWASLAAWGKRSPSPSPRRCATG